MRGHCRWLDGRPDGNVWFADRARPRDRADLPDGRVTEFSAGLNGGAKPTAIALGPDGNVWFVDKGTTHAIGKLNPSTGAITEYSSGLNAARRPAASRLDQTATSGSPIRARQRRSGESRPPA